MQWAYEKYGDKIYSELDKHEKAILDWCEENELNLNAKQSKSLLSLSTWQKQLNLLNLAKQLMTLIGNDEYNDFNTFRDKVNEVLKNNSIKISEPEKTTILNAVSWYDEKAEKVVKKISSISAKKLEDLLELLSCTENELSDYGYYKTDIKNEYIEYETESELRDYENVPLKENIYEYYLREVKPHVSEAWIDLDVTKIGSEISFNKYFYRHKPLRSLEEVSNDILQLEKESEGLINEILKLK